VRFGRFSLVGACAATAVLVAGCGTQHVPAGGGQPVSVAAAVSHTEGQTARMAVTMSTGSPGMTMTFTATGLMDFAHGRGTFSMQNPVNLTEVFLPPTVYVKVPSGEASLPKGKSWVAVPATAVDGSGAAGGLLGPFSGGGDPAGLLASLTAAASRVTKLGPSTVRGVPVTGFALTINAAKDMAKAPAADRALAESFLKSAGLTEIPVDVWVDNDNLVRRERVTLKLPASSGAPAGTSITTTTDFYDFGVPVRVSAPPAALVEREPSAFSMAGSSVAVGSGSLNTSAPPASGTLTPAQTTAADQAVTAFWAALGRGSEPAVAATVLPAERSCVPSLPIGDGAPAITVSGLHITSTRPADDTDATVFFTVSAQISEGGQAIPVIPQGPGSPQWLATTEVDGQWYVNLDHSTALAFGGSC
jgi:hypothetical protein